MPTIHTGQQVLVHTCGVIMRGIVRRIQPTPWGEPCYLIHGQWYSQDVHPDPSLKLRSQWFLDKLYTEPSDPPVLLVKHQGEAGSAIAKIPQRADPLARADASLEKLIQLAEALDVPRLQQLITLANGLLWSEETEQLINQFVGEQLKPLLAKDML